MSSRLLPQGFRGSGFRAPKSEPLTPRTQAETSLLVELVSGLGGGRLFIVTPAFSEVLNPEACSRPKALKPRTTPKALHPKSLAVRP